MARFRRMLPKDPKILGFVQKTDGTWNASRKETLEVLLNTHFINCVDPDSYPLGVADPICNAGMMSDLEEMITRNRVKWAINSFEPFKSSGPDGIFPALLQHVGNILHELLVSDGVIYLMIGKMCLWRLYQKPVNHPSESFGETYV